MKLLINPLSQRDPRWASQRLGTVDSTTIGSHGCVVTSAAMMLTYYGHPILPNQLDDLLTDQNTGDPKNTLYYDGNLFVDGNITILFPDIVSEGKIMCDTIPAPIDTIKKYLDEGKPVFVWVMNSLVKHCCLAVGYEDNQIIVNDPWQGDQVNISDRWGDSASKILQVNLFAGNRSITAPSSLSIDELRALDIIKDAKNHYAELINGNFEGAAAALEGAYVKLPLLQIDLNNANKTIAEIQNDNQTLQNELNTLRSELNAYKRGELPAPEPTPELSEQPEEVLEPAVPPVETPENEPTEVTQPVEEPILEVEKKANSLADLIIRIFKAIAKRFS